MNNQEDGKDEIVSNKMDGILRPHGNFDWGKIWSIEPWWFWGTQFWDNPRSLLVSSHRTGWMCQAVKSVHQVCSPCEVGICKVFEKKKNMSNALNKSRGCGTMEDCNGKQPRPVQSSAAKRRARAWLETAASTSRWRFFRGAGCKLFSSCGCNLARKMLMNSSHHPIPLKSS